MTKSLFPPGRRSIGWCALAALTACARPGGPPEAPTPTPADDTTEVAPPASPPPDRTRVTSRRGGPAADPRVALLAGLMPLSNTGADLIRGQNPTFDGRGVLIGILDSGIDAGLMGFQQTTTGEPKIVDLRDFSAEGRLTLRPVHATGGSITVGTATFTGFDHVATYASPPYYAAVLRELPLDKVDANANGRLDDEFVMFVVKTSSGWAVVTDADGDGRLEDEAPVHDYLVARETFTLASGDGKQHLGPLTFAVNVAEEQGVPQVDLFFDNSSHGSHVAGIAAGYNMFEVEGFDGVAPGARLLGIKIANNARGGITVTGSMVRAMNYAADFARQRGLPLILNMSFGVGNETEGVAAIDSLIDEFTLRHPDVLFVISAGNEGPGISSIGFPGSADNILSVCALFPGVFTGPRPQGFAVDADVIADFSSRGGEVAKPDICAPGVAFSNVPLWNQGEEISGGTSMAAPHVSGSAALLQSGRLQSGRAARAIDLKEALLASARPAPGATTVDMGAGVPNLEAAYKWLEAGHRAGVYAIRALPDGGNTSLRDGAYRRAGLQSPADTLQRFEIRSLMGQPAARLLLRSDQPWLRAPRTVEMQGEPATVQVRYAADRLRTPGLYVGTVWAVPASDTLAGAAFRLTNTIVVPQPLDQPFVEGRDLGPGRLRRYFFDIPEGSGGFVVEMEVRYPTQRGTLHLFEPNGQPFRGGASREVGGSDGPKARIIVRADDLVPGVYEAVVSAPPRSALSYELRAAFPRYAIDEIRDGPAVTVRMRPDAPTFVQDATVFQRADTLPKYQDSLQVIGEVIGATREFAVRGEGALPHLIDLRVPSWADDLQITVQLPAGLWSQMTDLGVTVYDSVGVEVGEAPLSYPLGRTTIDLERWRRGEPLTIELFPAFAHLDPPRTWNATVETVFLTDRRRSLMLMNVDTTRVLSMAPGASVDLRFAPVPDTFEVPTGFRPLVEVTVVPAGGAPSKRQRAILQ